MMTAVESLVPNHQAKCCHIEAYENMAIHLYEKLQTHDCTMTDNVRIT